MRSRREQLQAHRFQTRRIISAVVVGEPESPEAPMRRFGMAAFGSVILALVVLAVFAVLSQLRPVGSTSWQQENALIIEKETGARFVFRGGKLYPVINYASARLIAGQGAAPAVTVAGRSLEGSPRMEPLGILGAPDDLPTAKSLVGLPWRVCSYRAHQAVAGVPTAALVLGQDMAAGADPEDRAVLVREAESKQLYLLWNGKRLELSSDAMATLDYASSEPLDVSAAFLSAVPAGPALTYTIEDFGAAGIRVAGQGTRVGQQFIVKQPGGGQTNYVLLKEGLAQLSLLERRLLNVFTQHQDHSLISDKLTVIHATDVAKLDNAGKVLKSRREGLPPDVPELASVTGDDPALCIEHGGGRDSNASAPLQLYSTVPAALADRRRTGAAASDPVLANEVIVPGGRGALVVTPSRMLFLVTDQGRRFGLPDPKSAEVLGYAGVEPVEVPAELVALIPQGPPLDREAAQRPAKGVASPTNGG